MSNSQESTPQEVWKRQREKISRAIAWRDWPTDGTRPELGYGDVYETADGYLHLIGDRLDDCLEADSIDLSTTETPVRYGDLLEAFERVIDELQIARIGRPAAAMSRPCTCTCMSQCGVCKSELVRRFGHRMDFEIRHRYEGHYIWEYRGTGKWDAVILVQPVPEYFDEFAGSIKRSSSWPQGWARVVRL